MRKQTKKDIRELYAEKFNLKNGRMQIIYHGAYQASIQIFRGEKLVQDITVPCEYLNGGRLL